MRVDVVIASSVAVPARKIVTRRAAASHRTMNWADCASPKRAVEIGVPGRYCQVPGASGQSRQSPLRTGAGDAGGTGGAGGAAGGAGAAQALRARRSSRVICFMSLDRGAIERPWRINETMESPKKFNRDRDTP